MSHGDVFPIGRKLEGGNRFFEVMVVEDDAAGEVHEEGTTVCAVK